jgi:NAD(P)H-dependent flavin oxidoreductase YrpB (nitropropane dioxygenase family)
MTEQHPSQTLIQRLGVRYPVVQGGMTFGSDGALVAAVSEAGGLGTLGTFHSRHVERDIAGTAIPHQVWREGQRSRSAPSNLAAVRWF